MALTSLNRSPAGAGRLRTPPQAASARPYVSRISPADELQLACRLAECRRELLAIALLDGASGAELDRTRLELTSGARRLGQVLEGRALSKLDFDALHARLAEHQREGAAAFAPSAAPPELESAAERLLASTIELLKATPLASDLGDRLLQASWAATHLPAASEPRPLAPASLRRRARRLDSEMETIRSRFINANQGLVAYVVQRYRGMGLRREDLMQEGNIGLLRAIEKFDHRRGNRFSVYAVWWIRQAVRRALANQSRTIRIPVHALAVRYAIDQASKRLSLQLGREPSEQELASATGVVQSGVSQVLGLVKEPLSLDAPRGPESDSSLGESVADRAALSPNEQAARSERAARLHVLLDGLSTREREMLRMRFGLDGEDECTLEQIGQSFALTRERVRQIVTAALGKLHHQTQVRQLELEPASE